MSERKWLLACLSATCVSWLVLMSPLLPNNMGKIGHDYAYFLPRLLAGEQWIANNGLWSVPWFSPAFGAGLPAYAHPANGHYSLPQLLCLGMDPLSAVRWTAFLSMLAGFAGMWLVARRTLALGPGPSAFAAAAFALNGFHIARMAIGHLAFHASMLAPLCAWLLLRPASSRLEWWGSVLGAGLCLAYQLQSGNVYGIPPLALAVVAIACLHRLRAGTTEGFIGRGLTAGWIALCLSAAKLSAALAFLSSFPRSSYPLPGAGNPLDLAELLARALFLEPPAERARELFQNQPFLLGAHEWDLGLTPVPAIVLALGLVLLLAKDRQGLRWPPRAALILLLLVCALPLALNLHSAGWERTLKSVPILGSSSSFVRWLWLFVPLTILASACALERLQRIRGLALCSWVALAAFLGLQSLAPRKAYAEQPYNPRGIVDAWKRHSLPPIREVVIPPLVDRQIKLESDRDDEFLKGHSQLFTYEPLFGYRLEWFPKGPVRPGEATIGNFHHPLAFLYPQAAGRSPGEPFRAGEEAQLEALLNYRASEIPWPLRQRLANGIHLAALLALAVAAVALAYTSLRRQRSSSGS